jgi:hypothetical protein
MKPAASAAGFFIAWSVYLLETLTVVVEVLPAWSLATAWMVWLPLLDFLVFQL